MSARLILETPCRHGYVECLATIKYPLNIATNANDFIPKLCPGGTRRELDPVDLLDKVGASLYANLFDGQTRGTFTGLVDDLVAETVEAVGFVFEEQLGLDVLLSEGDQ